MENNAVDTGNHNIIQGTLTHANNPNYTIGFAATPVTYEIKPAAIVVTPVSGMGKDFDNQAVTLSGTDKYSFTVDGETKALVNGYSLNVVLGLKNDAVTIGNHEIVAKSLAVNGPRPENYTISLATTPVTYTISEVSIKVIPNANQTAVYGSNAVISYTTEPATLPDGVELSGALGISAKTVGKHAVGIGTLELTGTNAINYRLVLADGAEFEITEKPITVTPDSDQKKTYDGKTAENITYTAPDLIQGDSLTGSLKLENDAVAAGTYKIVIGTLTNPNYKITLTPDVAFTIEKKAVTVTPNAGQEKEYDKTAPENIQYTVELIGNDELTGSLALENDAVNAGVHKIVAGTLENTNYAITVAEVDYTIIPRALTVTPDAGQSKDYDGQTASEITYTADGLLEGDELTGALALENDAVEVGTHAIVIGTLANPNYDITLEAAEYQIIGKEEPNPINPDVSDPDENQDSDNQEQEIEKTGISIEWLVIAFIAMVGSVAVLAITKKSKETR